MRIVQASRSNSYTVRTRSLLGDVGIVAATALGPPGVFLVSHQFLASVAALTLCFLPLAASAEAPP